MFKNMVQLSKLKPQTDQQPNQYLLGILQWISQADDVTFSKLDTDWQEWYNDQVDRINDESVSDINEFVADQPEGFNEFWDSYQKPKEVEPVKEEEPEIHGPEPEQEPEPASEPEPVQEQPDPKPVKTPRKPRKQKVKKEEKPVAKDSEPEAAKPAKKDLGVKNKRGRKPASETKGVPLTQQIRAIIISNIELSQKEVLAKAHEKGLNISPQTVTVVYLNTIGAVRELLVQNGCYDSKGNKLFELSDHGEKFIKNHSK